MKAKNSPTAQKVIAVSDDDQLEKIDRETQGLQAEFRNALALWKISEVQQVSQNLQGASTTVREKVGSKTRSQKATFVTPYLLAIGVSGKLGSNSGAKPPQIRGIGFR